MYCASEVPFFQLSDDIEITGFITVLAQFESGIQFRHFYFRTHDGFRQRVYIIGRKVFKYGR